MRLPLEGMAEESTLPASSAPDFSDRVDALLSSALAEQAREKRQLVDTLYGAKAALTRAEEQIAALREQIAQHDAELLAQVDKRFEERISAVEEALIKIARSVSQVPAKVRGDIETAAVAVGDRVGDESDALLRHLREDAVEVVATIGKLSDKNLAQTQNAIEAAREEYRTTTEQMVNYLGQRDDALQARRDQVLVELFRQLGESLGRRNSKKLGKAISSDPEIGTRPVAGRPGAPPPPQRQYPSPAPGAALGRGTSIVTPPVTAPPRFGAGAAPPTQSPTEATPHISDEAGDSQAEDVWSAGRGAGTPVSGYGERAPLGGSAEPSSRVLGPIVPEQESKPRRGRRKKEQAAPEPAKAPPKRVIRRKPPA